MTRLILAIGILFMQVVAPPYASAPNVEPSPHQEALMQAGMAMQQEGPTPEGTATSCDNYRTTPEGHRCHCARDKQECEGKTLPEPDADVEMDKTCKTYCKTQNCHCAGHGCRSMTH